jgi:CubicO group peptidase (beta-lactamase class C family)
MRPQRSRTRTTLQIVASVATLATTASACTTYRIVRWRDALPHQPARIFEQRTVTRAATPFHFHRAPSPRADLDTLRVRDVDGVMRPFAEYLQRRRIKGFLVVRNDTILYERYREPLTESRVWSSYSVAKSVTSLLVGRAVASGALRLDDPVTKYVPEAAGLPAYAGVTVRHLLRMESGFAYTRTQGQWWHDLRSDDAHFYYTTDRVRSLLAVQRADPPGARWAYKDSDIDLLGLVLTRATRKTLAEQLSAIWSRIGTEQDAFYSLDRRGGVESASSGLSATARDFARLGRLALDYGRWGHTSLVDSAWVHATTELDTSRSEPEVVTWYRMQHQGLWWIPMHNWSAERDFFADGSRGQRIYVHRPSRTIIVQLAEDSQQEFPFRRITHFLIGEPYRYPVGIAGNVLRAARQFGADSAGVTLERLLAEEARTPAGYVVNEAGLLAVADQLAGQGDRASANAVLRSAAPRYGGSCRFRSALEDAGLLVPLPATRPASSCSEHRAR